MDYLVKTTNFPAPVAPQGRNKNCLAAIAKSLFATVAVTMGLMSSGSAVSAANPASYAIAGDHGGTDLRDRLLKLGNLRKASQSVAVGKTLCYSACSPVQELSNSCVFAETAHDISQGGRRLSLGRQVFYASLIAQH
jgi:hypothetical protein